MPRAPLSWAQTKCRAKPSCGKRSYLTRADAKQAARKAIAHGGDPVLVKARLSAYRCPTSSVWHIGHASALNRQCRREAAAS